MIAQCRMTMDLSPFMSRCQTFGFGAVARRCALANAYTNADQAGGDANSGSDWHPLQHHEGQSFHDPFRLTKEYLVEMVDSRRTVRPADRLRFATAMLMPPPTTLGKPHP